ncbi:MAG: vitamin K epoxide reductase family protein [Pyrinomonadaceae bacterium]
MTDFDAPANQPKLRKLPLVAAIVAFAGLVDAVYLTIHHYTAEPVPCGLEFDCGVVLNSWWAEIGGVPLAAFGVLGYLTALSLALFAGFKNGRLWSLFGVQASLMAAVSGYLIYVQYALILAWCQYCLISAATSFTLFLLFIISLFVGRPMPGRASL